MQWCDGDGSLDRKLCTLVRHIHKWVTTQTSITSGDLAHAPLRILQPNLFQELYLYILRMDIIDDCILEHTWWCCTMESYSAGGSPTAPTPPSKAQHHQLVSKRRIANATSCRIHKYIWKCNGAMEMVAWIESYAPLYVTYTSG